MKVRGAKEVRLGSSGRQRARTTTSARRSLTQAGDKKGGQQPLTAWLRPKMPSTVRSSTEDSRGGQRLLTSWMRPKTSPFPAVYAVPAPLVEHISRAAVHFSSSCRVFRTSCIGGVRESSANGEHRRASAYGAICYICGVHLSGDSAELRSTRSSAVCNSGEARSASAIRCTHDDCEWSRLEQGWHFRCTPATSGGYLAPIQHGVLVQYGGPLIYAPVLKNTWTVTGVDTILLAYAKVVRCSLSALMRWGEGRCAALPRGLCDRGREKRGFPEC